MEVDLSEDLGLEGERREIIEAIIDREDYNEVVAKSVENRLEET